MANSASEYDKMNDPENGHDVSVRQRGQHSAEISFASHRKYFSKDRFSGSRYIGYNGVDFSIPINESTKLIRYMLEKCEDWRIVVDPSLRLYAEREIAKERGILEVSTAKDGDIPNDILQFPFKPIQRAAIKFQEYEGYNKICSLATGAGKTPTALGYAERGFNNKYATKGYRTLWITKASLVESAKLEIAKFTGKSAIILSGRIPSSNIISAMMSERFQYFILPYEIIGTELEKDTKEEASKRPWAIALNMLSDAGYIDLCVEDEAHLWGNMETLRCKTILALTCPRHMPMTATPIVNSGAELFPLLKRCAPETFSSESAFLRTYFYENGKTVKDKKALQKMLSLYMFRRDFADIYGDSLPVVERTIKQVEIDDWNRERLRDAEDGIFAAMDGSERELTHILPKLNAFRQIVGDAKVPHTIEYARELIAEGRKPLVFFCFQENAERAARELGCKFIHGGVPMGLRQEFEQDYQKNPNCKALVVSVKTTQEGLTLTSGTDVIFNDQCWTQKDHKQGEGRVFLRANDLHGGLTTMMVTNTEIDKLMSEIIMRKMRLADAAVDGSKEYAEANVSIVRELISRLRGLR